ncbi:hypothetical protein [Streptomyces sp. ALB3]|uniref:hypothetical protein n=1 Tax=Streptomyces sp. ALB3 TaxID=3374278 RepID=UPI0037B03B3E
MKLWASVAEVRPQVLTAGRQGRGCGTGQGPAFPSLVPFESVSFESRSAPDSYLPHRGALLYVERVGTADRPGTTFRAW